MAEAVSVPGFEAIIIGGGPAGIAAAVELSRLGVRSIALLEREEALGGIPRHCGHPPFGMREFGRILTGPRYAARLAGLAASLPGVAIMTRHAAVAIAPGGAVTATTPEGVHTFTARRIILATGIRETPRAARLVSGTRPLGVVNTGALQAMVYLENLIPFRRPVIVGTELVAFSALLTCRTAGIRPVAMIEESERIVARRFSAGLPRLLGVPLWLRTRLDAIEGGGRVTAVRVADTAGTERRIDCDGVIFTGGFQPEATLVRMGHLALDPATGGPSVDQYGRCSDPVFFAAGNVLRPVETAAWCYREGRQTGRFVAADLAGKLAAATEALPIEYQEPIRFVVPQRIARPSDGVLAGALQLRLMRRACGRIALIGADEILTSRRIDSLPERRILIPLAGLRLARATSAIKIVIGER